MITKEALAQVFSCDFCQISKNAFSYRTSPVAASAKRNVWHATLLIQDATKISVGTNFENCLKWKSEKEHVSNTKNNKYLTLELLA